MLSSIQAFRVSERTMAGDCIYPYDGRQILGGYDARSLYLGCFSVRASHWCYCECCGDDTAVSDDGLWCRLVKGRRPDQYPLWLTLRTEMGHLPESGKFAKLSQAMLVTGRAGHVILQIR